MSASLAAPAGPIAIHATIGPKALKNASKYYAGTPYSRAVEILQNARRAGATAVDIRTAPSGDVVIADNGRGLAAADARLLLQFGGSGNDAAIELKEDPAGMGFFSLAGLRVEAASRDWRMTIPPGAFSGEAEARLVVDGADRTGLTLTVQGLARNGEAAREAFLRAARPMGLSCTIDGAAVEPLGLRDLLLAGDRVIEEQAEIMGATVIVQRSEGQPFAKAPGQEDRHHSDTIIFNLFGQLLSFARTEELFAATQIDLRNLESPVIATPVVHEHGAPKRRDIHWRVVVDVADTAVITPRLPARDDILRNEGLKAVEKTVVALAARILARAAANGIAAGHKLRTHAAIPPAQVAVEMFRPGSTAEGYRAPVDTVAALYNNGALAWMAPALKDARSIVRVEADDNDTQWLAHDLLGDGRDGVAAVVDPVTIDAGELGPRLTGLRIDARIGERAIAIDPDDRIGWSNGEDETAAALQAFTDGRCYLGVDALVLRATLEHGGGRPATRIEKPVPFAVLDIRQDNNEPLVLVRDRTVGTEPVLDRMLAVMDWLSDDHEAGSYDDQIEDWSETYARQIDTVTLGDERARFMAARNALQKHVERDGERRVTAISLEAMADGKTSLRVAFADGSAVADEVAW